MKSIKIQKPSKIKESVPKVAKQSAKDRFEKMDLPYDVNKKKDVINIKDFLPQSQIFEKQAQEMKKALIQPPKSAKGSILGIDDLLVKSRAMKKKEE